MDFSDKFTCGWWMRRRMLESSYNFLFGKLALKCLFEDYFEEAQHFRTMIMLKPIDDPHVDLVATVSFFWLWWKNCTNFLSFIFSCFLNCDQVSGPLDHRPEENIVGKAFFRWQRCRRRILFFDINVEIWKQLQWTSSWYVSCGTVMLTILIHSLTFTCRAPIRKQHPINNLFDFTISFCSFNFQKHNFLHRILQMRSCVFKPKHGIGAFGVFPVLQRKRCNFIKKILYQHMICILV